MKSALRLVALDATAERMGLRPGLPLADARAMIPGLEAVDADEAADAALLAALADWAERYTPLVALDPPDGLMLDITGSAHLFGGETALIADLAARLEAQGFAAHAAIADTPGAASAAARFGGPAVVPPGGARDMLAPLPLAALRLDIETVSALDRVGLKRIGQILEAPRGPLAGRFGADLMRRLDQALGREEEAIGPRRPVPALIAERRFAEPIVSEDDIAATLASLAAALAASLEARGHGARGLRASAFPRRWRRLAHRGRHQPPDPRPKTRPRSFSRDALPASARRSTPASASTWSASRSPGRRRPSRPRSILPAMPSAKPISASSSTASAPVSDPSG